VPVIPIDFSTVETFDNLPLSKYYGSIDKVELRPATDPTKFDQLMATYLVTDGDQLGRKSSEFLSLSPKAAFRLKRWFDHFGLSDELEALEVDDDTNLLTSPDLVGVDVIFEVYQDPKLYQGEKQVRTRLLEVLEDAPAPVPAPKARAATAARPAAKPAPAPEPELDEEEEEEEEAPAPVTPARRPTTKAAITSAPARRTLR